MQGNGDTRTALEFDQKQSSCQKLLYIKFPMDRQFLMMVMEMNAFGSIRIGSVVHEIFLSLNQIS